MEMGMPTPEMKYGSSILVAPAIPALRAGTARYRLVNNRPNI